MSNPNGSYFNKGNHSGSESILASIFKNILLERGITIERFHNLINKYILRMCNNKKNATYKGNLAKELLSPTMTWKVFIKGLNFLNIKKFDLSIIVHEVDGSKTKYTRTIVIDESNETQDTDV